MYSVLQSGKNAVEAASRSELSQKVIRLRIGQEERRLSIHIENTFDPDEQNRQIGGTVKEDKRSHGFGTQIIDEIVEIYGGIYVREVVGEWFFIEVRIEGQRNKAQERDRERRGRETERRREIERGKK